MLLSFPTTAAAAIAALCFLICSVYLQSFTQLAADIKYAKKTTEISTVGGTLNAILMSKQ